jgi:hypothetical protein
MGKTLHCCKNAAASLIVLTLIIVSSCARIPKDTVVLSKEVGKGIAENQRAYISLFNRYFEQKKTLIDQSITEKYIPLYIENIRKELEVAGQDPDSLGTERLKDILTDVIKKRDEMQSELEKTRIMLIERISADHDLLLQANATITGLLQSAVDVKEATSALGETLVKPLKSGFDFDEFEKIFDNYLDKSANIAGEAEKLSEKVKLLFKKGGR